MTMNIMLATNNLNKVSEFNKIILKSRNDINIVPASRLSPSDVDETGTSYLENALLKAKAFAKCSEFPVLADDSGFEVTALNHCPGIFSARYHPTNPNCSNNLNYLVSQLLDMGLNSSRALYRCVLVYLRNYDDPVPIVCEATWEGTVKTTAQGVNGFGYDPIFYPDNYKVSSAELADDVKLLINHRAMAIQKLLSKIKR
ncbi:non-canonical purine NTP pyrophosphatase [Rheinheimera baltica]|uniref:non-canonical purine NTP pyrophosphatase n=1 Tax=Rheinheimera baltica TaxID=67576 RepID=UPI000482C0C2|nr:non-canonical purine NTP pyrophosphatase [Rheinheimera baltica]